MGMEYYIDTPTSVGSDENGQSNCNFEPCVAYSPLSCDKAEAGILKHYKLEQTEDERRKIDGQHNEETHLIKASFGKLLNGSVELAKSDSFAEEMNTFSSAVHMENDDVAAQQKSTIIDQLHDKSMSGSKRGGMTANDQQPLVHVAYQFLSRESNRKLEELLHQWSEWHAQHSSSSVDSNEDLESGEETYFPALYVGPGKSSTMCFLMDRQVRKRQKKEIILNVDSVPLYDRGYELALTSVEGLTNLESGMEKVNGSRCFNCGSYGHLLNECPKPRDNVAVNSARKEHQSKKTQTAGPRFLTRYYQDSPRGKYDGLKPGVLAAETRKQLGLGELDPPPWLNRMREMGYPPGYLEVGDEDQPSGITIYADEETEDQKVAYFKVDVSEPQKKMSVDFPGINAPIPENADQSCWADCKGPHSVKSSMNQSYHQPDCSKEFTSDGHFYCQRWPMGSMDYQYPDHGPEYSSYISDVNPPIPDNADQRRWADCQRPHGFNSLMNQSDHQRNWSGGFASSGHFYHQRWLMDSMDSRYPDYEPEYNPYMSAHSRSYSDFDHNYISKSCSSSFLPHTF